MRLYIVFVMGLFMLYRLYMYCVHVGHFVMVTLNCVFCVFAAVEIGIQKMILFVPLRKVMRLAFGKLLSLQPGKLYKNTLV